MKAITPDISSLIDEVPYPENLVKFAHSLLEQYGTQQKAARALGVTDSVFRDRYLEGTVQRPSEETARNIARIMTERTGKVWTPQMVLCWIWMKPEYDFAGSPGIPDANQVLVSIDGVADLMKACENTLAKVKEQVRQLNNQHQQTKEGAMCVEVYKLFIQKVSENWNLARDSDYKKFCKKFRYNPDGAIAQHLKEIVLGQSIPHRGDHEDIKRILRGLNDTTTVADLLDRCSCEAE